MTDDVPSNNLTTAQGAERIKALLNPQPDNQAPAQPEPEAETEEVSEDEGEAIEAQDVEPAEAEDEQAEDNSDLYEVTVDGEKKQVTLNELVKGYQLEAHYTQKSQKLAEDRKAVEAERTVLSGVTQKFEQLNEVVTYLQHANQFIESTIPAMPDESLLDSNPAAYIKAQKARDNAIQNMQFIQQGMAQTKAKAKELVGELQKAGAAVLAEKMPEILQPETSQKLYGYLQNDYGYTADQINMNVDPNLFMIAEKARRYDEMKAKSVDPVHVAQKVTKVKAKPKPYQNKAVAQHKAAKSEFEKNPSFGNAAALIKANGYA